MTQGAQAQLKYESMLYFINSIIFSESGSIETLFIF
jgi:hypothetical protein